MNCAMIIGLLAISLLRRARTFNVHQLPSDEAFSHAIEATIGIINSCYTNQGRNIILSGSIDDILMDATTHSTDLLKIRIQNAPYDRHSTKLQLDNHPSLFVVVAASNGELQTHIAILKTLPQWSVNEHHFILVRSDGCRKAFEFLRVTWNANLLSIIFVCYQGNQVNVYGFNPYANIAPEPWLSAESEALEIPPWAMFKRPYSNDMGQEICESLFWDKTKKLNGYDVKVNGIDLPILLELKPRNEQGQQLGGCDGKILQQAFNFMNLTPIVSLEPFGDPRVDSDGNPSGLFIAPAAGTSDVMANSAFTTYLKNTTISATHYESGMRFGLQKPRPLTTLQKLIKYLAGKLLVGSIIAAVVMAIIYKYLFSESWSTSSFHAIRMLSTVMLGNVKTMASRLFFAGALFSFLTIQTAIQARMASLLAVTIFEPTLNTQEDLLAHPEYTLRSLEYFRAAINDELRPHIIKEEDMLCEECYVKDPHCVCFWRSIIAQAIAVQYNLHLSTDIVSVQALVFFIHNEWPLQNRFKQVISRLTESHIIEVIINREIEAYRKSRSGALNDDTKAGIITSKSLAFAFQFLAFSLICASFVFLLEIRIWRIKLMTLKNLGKMLIKK